ncbi:GNAT family N-acetyltransferase [Streptomyces sp. SID8381]|uniref:GNAT family N-acetyltransferase n=1 Tax=unclassified Streptomyces TaxID=2593676 RepID=UPI00037C6F30|nr:MULTISPECIES: GNAT family N-acetyltransferase [unclassified Streptomyces]MYX27230.1 GNAT family N-acetyltransferase [Streptomyces sp. SID8381]
MRAEIVRTARLELVPLEAGHAGEMAEVLADPALHEFIGGAPLGAARLRERYARLAGGSPDPEVSWCNWVMRTRERPCRLVGTVQATVTAGGSVAEVAWVVGTAWQGRGFASEAARGLVGLLERRGVGLVLAHIHPEHRASAAVARAAGLAPTDERADGEAVWRLALGGR